MKLTSVIKKIIKEQDDNIELDNTIEFPKENFILSIDRPKKKIIFSPQYKNTSIPSKIRTLIVMLKQRFDILNVNSLEDKGTATQANDQDISNLKGVFEIEVDPSENFESIIDYIQQESEKSK